MVLSDMPRYLAAREFADNCLIKHIVPHNHSYECSIMFISFEHCPKLMSKVFYDYCDRRVYMKLRASRKLATNES